MSTTPYAGKNKTETRQQADQPCKPTRPSLQPTTTKTTNQKLSGTNPFFSRANTLLTCELGPPIVGVCDVDEFPGPLGHALSEQERHSVLRDDVVHVGSRRHHPGTLRTHRHTKSATSDGEQSVL